LLGWNSRRQYGKKRLGARKAYRRAKEFSGSGFHQHTVSGKTCFSGSNAPRFGPPIACSYTEALIMRIQPILKTYLITLVLLALTPTLGIAQLGRNRDQGQYEIVQATYGTVRRNVDVTARLRDLARVDSTFVMGNSTFGVDPDPNSAKTLRISARDANGQSRVFQYSEGSRIDGSMFTGWSNTNAGRNGSDTRWENERNGTNADEGQYEIIQARYGTAGRNIDVTNRLKQLARRDQTFRMDNATFGVDPDQGVPKTLRIFAQDRRGRERMFEYNEGSTVDGSLFIGWNGGNFARSGVNRSWGQSNSTAAAVNRQSLNIVRATYGAGRQRRDVTGRLQSMIRGGRLSVNVDNGVMGGDPALNVPKELLVTFIDQRGTQQQVRVEEGERLNLP
jgi:hypothetical protein